MKRIVIGTAGHVDHGKTSLTQKLTGINTDRLEEEQSRGISIELGFAPLQLKDDLLAGIVDVPGHEKFIKTMLAGVAGIDFVLFVIAADEGIMPQTTEHLDILTLLGIKKGIVVLSKADLVDEEWLELMTEEVKAALSTSFLANAPILPVSAVTGQGLDVLLEKMTELAAGIEPRSSAGQPRMPIDRSFSITGFGTVATGTLWSGQLQLGEYLEVFPTGKTGRIRSLQNHGKKQDTSQAGQRVAVNLAGLEVADVPKGGWLAPGGFLKPSFRLDVVFQLLPSAKELVHHARLRIHHGTQEVLGRIHFLDREALKPGESCYAQLTLEEPVPPLRGDRLVIRSYSPMSTIAGATVIETQARRHKRYQPQIMEALAQKAKGRPEDTILQLLEQGKDLLLPAQAIQAQSHLEATVAEAALQTLVEEKQVTALLPLYASVYRLQQVWQQTEQALQTQHNKYPLRPGLSKEEFRSRLLENLPQKQAAPLLAYWQQEGLIKTTQEAIALPDFQPRADPALEKWRQKTEKALLDSGFAPPAWHTLTEALPPQQQAEVLPWLEAMGSVVKLQGEIIFHKQKADEAIALALQLLDEQQELTLGAMRDAMNTSRKYALAFLEYLDQQKITKRSGDIRVKY